MPANLNSDPRQAESEKILSMTRFEPDPKHTQQQTYSQLCHAAALECRLKNVDQKIFLHCFHNSLFNIIKKMKK
jgi:hypothetical protein